jgi:hypothetical protein
VAGSYFCSSVIRTIGDDLNVYLNQLIAGIDIDAQERLVVTRPPADPRFADPLSGLYWQVVDDRGQLLRSRSLWDTELDLPPDNPAEGEVHQHVMAGPAKAHVLVAERMVQLTVGGQPLPVRVGVAADLSRVSAATVGFSKDLMVALGLLGLVLALATAIQVARPRPWPRRQTLPTSARADPSSASGRRSKSATGRGGQCLARCSRARD